MILYDPQQKMSFTDFGIMIPIHDSKSRRTFEYLKNHPILGPRSAQWYCKKDPNRLSRTDLLRVHAAAYIDRLYSDKLQEEIIRTYELIDASGRYHRYEPAQAVRPLSELFDRILDRVSGSWQCCSLALQSGFCFYFGGGMHHAQQDYGNGFCLLNDIVIAVRKLQAERRIKIVWIIDVDAHKGDGTAALTADDETIVTLSVHMQHGWPLDGPARDPEGRPNPSFTPSTIDVPIAADEGHRYVEKLKAALQDLDTYPPADIAVVVSGVDPYEGDALPSTKDLNLSLAQLLQRDQCIYRFLKQRNIPKAYLMAGGYGPNAWRAYAQFLEWALLDHLNLKRGAGEDLTG
jgi:acetoin utilization deacetylase AcuC-like enzyme